MKPCARVPVQMATVGIPVKVSIVFMQLHGFKKLVNLIVAQQHRSFLSLFLVEGHSYT